MNSVTDEFCVSYNDYVLCYDYVKPVRFSKNVKDQIQFRKLYIFVQSLSQIWQCERFCFFRKIVNS